jgi:periplasmic protein TonB
VLALLLTSFQRPPLIPEPPDQVATVELVLNHAEMPGLTPQPQSQQQPEKPQPTQKEETAAEPLPTPPAPPPVPPAPPAPEAPQINIGGNESDSNTLVTSMGPFVIPAGVDTKYHNRHPIYPEEAARLGEEGAVVLLIHVSPQGVPSSIDIVESSGYDSLDQSARDAALTWHFLPAMKDGLPVPFDMPFRMVFHLDKQ